MQRIAALWKSGIAGKLLIGCGGLIGLAIVCGICGTPFAQKPAPTPHPTATPYPTHTTLAQPTSTPIPPSPIPIPPTPTPLSPAGRLQTAIEKALGPSNREGVARISQFSVGAEPDAQIFIEWTINDNLTEGLIKSGAQIDIADILEAIDESGFEYGSLFVEGTFSMVDQYGNASEMVVISARYTRTTVERINWESFLWDNVYAIADEVWVHPAFQK